MSYEHLKTNADASMYEFLGSLITYFDKIVEEEVDLCYLHSLDSFYDWDPFNERYGYLQCLLLYLLRYAYGYAYEYKYIYEKLLYSEKLIDKVKKSDPAQLKVASIGCGNYLDYWSLVNLLNDKKENVRVCYTGIDLVDWLFSFRALEGDEIIPKESDKSDIFKYVLRDTNELDYDIFFFPKSISEIPEALEKLGEDLGGSNNKKDEFYIAVSYPYSNKDNDYAKKYNAENLEATKTLVRIVTEQKKYKTNANLSKLCLFERKQSYYIRDYDSNFERNPEIDPDVEKYVTEISKKCKKCSQKPDKKCEERNYGCYNYTNEEECCNKLNQKMLSTVNHIAYNIVSFTKL